LKYYDIKSLYIQGIIAPKLFRNYPAQRLPQKFENSIRKEVWELSENSAGASISFITDTPELIVKWNIKNNLSMNHMTDTGIKGIDLYQKKNGTWFHTSTGLPKGKENKQTLFEGLSKELREFRLHLPLYDTVTNIQFGLNNNSKFKIIKNKNRSIIFYGTSLTQGGCASRPGLAYTNIISRELDNECINLGFSGNGHLENAIGKILSSIDAKMYVVECMANIDKKIVRNNTLSLIKTIRKNGNNLKTPIVFFEQCITNLDSLYKDSIKSVLEKNDELKKQVKIAENSGHKNLHIIKQVGCIDEDSESTIDGIHFNDLGSQRYAKHFVKYIYESNIF
tara:strand:- start:122 stop:1132 length:1011 start_codon:yes stop_codon:yes gene_type:complete